MDPENTRRYGAKQGARSKQSGHGLFGSGKEIPAIACSPDGKYMAFASKGVIIIKGLVRKAD
jgi:hypothetical protein